MGYHLRTLGRLSLHPDPPDASSVLSDSKSLALLAYVAAVPGRRARRSHLADLLWPHSDRKRARSSLRQALYYLSQRAEDGLALTDDGMVAPNPRKLRVDLWAFDEALEGEDWERAVELYEGPFLGGYSVQGAREFEGWSEAQNERIWSGLKAAYYRLVEERSEAGEREAAVGYAREYVELNPLDETAQRTLIRAQLAADDRVGAYRSYERYRSLLREELGAEPGEELEARMERLRDRLFVAPVAEAPDAPDVEIVDAAEDDAPAGGAEAAGGAASPSGNAASTGPGDGGGRAWTRAAGWLAAGIAAGAVLGAGVSLLVGGPGTGGPDRAQWEAAEGRLLAWSGRDEVQELAVRNGRARVEASGLARTQYPSPDGSRRLEPRDTPDGPDVAVVDAATGEALRVVADDRADEVPLGWGPRGRHALYWKGERRDGDRTFVRHLRIVDTETGRSRPVQRAPELGSRLKQATWSPLGPWIAFRGVDSAGGADIYVAHADGTGLRRVSPQAGAERDPAWSPAGDRLAYTSVRGGEGDIHVVGLDGEDPEAVTHGTADDRYPVWLSPRHLAFLSDRSGKTDVWLLDLHSRRLRRLTEDGGYRGLRALQIPARTAPLERLRITPRPDTVSPGQRLRLAVRGWTADGEEMNPDLLPVAWRTDEVSVLRMDDDGTWRVETTGTAHVAADAGGWTADTLRLLAHSMRRAAPDMAFRETWEDGIPSGRWTVFGEPAPYVTDPGPRARIETSVGPGSTRVFVNNGDANYASGVVSRDAFRLEGAWTVEIRVALPFTRRHYQSVEWGLVASEPEPGAPSWSEGRRKVTLQFGASPDGSHARLHGPEETWDVPLPPSPGRWHRYALQVEADGRVAYLVDGRLLWRSPEPAAEPLEGRRLHVMVAGRSLHTELEVGRVTVWRGHRYRFGAEPALTRLAPGPPALRGAEE